MQNRRSFLQLGAAVLSSAALANGANSKSSSEKSEGLNSSAWKKNDRSLPVVWPDVNKYKGTKKVPGMCQLCSTVCGIMGHVKDGRIIKIEGNPNDPNSRGRLCARGQAGLNLSLIHI